MIKKIIKWFRYQMYLSHIRRIQKELSHCNYNEAKVAFLDAMKWKDETK